MWSARVCIVVLAVLGTGCGDRDSTVDVEPEAGAAAVVASDDATEPTPEHAVLVYFTYPHRELDELFALEEKLIAVIAAADVGEFDGNEVSVDGTDCTLFMYGPDADALFATIRPTLDASEYMRGARVKLRYGPPEDGVRELEVVLGP